jgi:hypothetical protein
VALFYRKKCSTVTIKVGSTFINLPFKFYLEIDNETPGQVGGWMGWQIVRSYMKTMSIFAAVIRYKMLKKYLKNQNTNLKVMSDKNRSELNSL